MNSCDRINASLFIIVLQFLLQDSAWKSSQSLTPAAPPPPTGIIHIMVRFSPVSVYCVYKYEYIKRHICAGRTVDNAVY